MRYNRYSKCLTNLKPVKLDISPSLISNNKIESGQIDKLLHFKIGQRLTAKVISIQVERNTLELEIAGKFFEARSEHRLSTNQRLQLEVSKLHPEPELKILNSDHASNRPVILNLIKPLTTPDQTTRYDHLSQLRQGQQITAKIISISENRIQVQLNTGTGTFTEIFNIDRSMALHFKTGQIINLLVNHSSSIPELIILSAALSPLLTDTLRKYLPRHESHSVYLNQLMTNFSTLFESKLIPETLIRLTLQILQGLPTRQQLTSSQTLAQSINNSGIFLEAKIRQLIGKSSSIDSDYKTKLLKFLLSLKTAKPEQIDSKTSRPEMTALKELQAKTHSSLAKLVLDQLASLPKSDDPKQAWHFELPFIDHDNIESINIDIEKDNNNLQQNKGNWSVNMTLEPKELGMINCKVFCIDGSINTHFQADQGNTAKLIKNNLQQLKDQLEKSGLNPGHMDVFHGLPESTQQLPKSEDNLFNEKA